jgi:hypothetical protein
MVPNKLFVKLVKLIVLNAVKEKENNVKYVNPVFILIKEYAKILETDVLTQLQLVNVKIVDMVNFNYFINNIFNIIIFLFNK